MSGKNGAKPVLPRFFFFFFLNYYFDLTKLLVGKEKKILRYVDVQEVG